MPHCAIAAAKGPKFGGGGGTHSKRRRRQSEVASGSPSPLVFLSLLFPPPSSSSSFHPGFHGLRNQPAQFDPPPPPAQNISLLQSSPPFISPPPHFCRFCRKRNMIVCLLVGAPLFLVVWRIRPRLRLRPAAAAGLSCANADAADAIQCIRVLWRSHRSSLGSGLGSDLLLYANKKKAEILWDIGEKQRDTIGFSALVATEQGMEEEHTQKKRPEQGGKRTNSPRRRRRGGTVVVGWSDLSQLSPRGKRRRNRGREEGPDRPD